MAAFFYSAKKITALAGSGFLTNNRLSIVHHEKQHVGQRPALAPPAGQRRCATWPDCYAISRTRRGFSPALTYKKAQRCWAFLIGGERGIRTLDTLLTYTHFPGVRLQPLGHLTVRGCTLNNWAVESNLLAILLSNMAVVVLYGRADAALGIDVDAAATGVASGHSELLGLAVFE